MNEERGSSQVQAVIADYLARRRGRVVWDQLLYGALLLLLFLLQDAAPWALPAFLGVLVTGGVYLVWERAALVRLEQRLTPLLLPPARAAAPAGGSPASG